MATDKIDFLGMGCRLSMSMQGINENGLARLYLSEVEAVRHIHVLFLQVL